LEQNPLQKSPLFTADKRTCQQITVLTAKYTAIDCHRFGATLHKIVNKDSATSSSSVEFEN